MRRSVLAGAVAAFAALPASAAQAATVSCGQVITASITVSNDLSECQSHGLVVGAHNITIDLDGHTIDGTGVNTGIFAENFNGVTVKEGTVKEFGNAVEGRNLSGLRVYWMNVRGVSRGVFLNQTTNSTVDRVDSSGANNGVEVTGTGNVVRRSTLSSNGAGVIATGSQHRYESNRILGNVFGMILTDTNATVYFNEIRDSVVFGIFGLVAGASIDRNTVTDSGAEGMFLLLPNTATTVRRNVLSGNGQNGMDIIGSGALVRENVARNNGGWGILAPNSVDGGQNVASGNAEPGQCSGVVCS